MCNLFLSRQLSGTQAGFHAFLQPALLGGVADVHVFNTNGTAVGVAQSLHDVAKGHLILTKVGVGGGERDVHIRFGQTVEGWI